MINFRTVQKACQVLDEEGLALHRSKTRWGDGANEEREGGGVIKESWGFASDKERRLSTRTKTDAVPARRSEGEKRDLASGQKVLPKMKQQAA